MLAISADAIEKKSPRKGTKTRRYHGVTLKKIRIEKKSPRKGTKTFRVTTYVRQSTMRY